MSRRVLTLVSIATVLSACVATSNPEADESSRLDDTATTDSTGTSTTDSTSTSGSTPTTDSTSTSGSTPTTDDSVPSSLTWSECDPDDVTPPPEGLPVAEPECTTLDVPLDYDDPDGEQIELALIRYPATGDRQGAILTNPGGPGGSGIEFIANAGSTMTGELGVADFDIVGFDPRGVDRSGGLDCVEDEWLDVHLFPDLTPDDRTERQILDVARSGIYEACSAMYGEKLAFYSTANTARDMDEIRAALGDEQMSYLGISYGTYLGAVYATLFPDRVRAMVLDSSYEPTGDSIEEQYTTQLVGFEGAFESWATWCAETDTCSFGDGGAEAVLERWDELVTTLDRDPLPLDDGRVVNQATMFSATIASMYSEASWPDLGEALSLAEDGDGAAVQRIADRFSNRSPDGTYKTGNEAGPVIRCASGLVQEEPDDPQSLLEEIRSVAPHFSLDARVEDLRNYCELMLDEPAEAVVPSYDGDAPILVTGGTNDPATPMRWAEELVELMGPSAVLVRFNGEGHGQLLSSDCVTELEGKVLADLELPPDGTECEPDPAIEKPDWWDELPTPEGISEVQSLPSVLAVLGLSSASAYGEVRLSELTVSDIQDAYEQELDDAFTKVTDVEILPDVNASYFAAPEGLILLVLVLPPEAFEGKELENSRGVVPEGQTAVVLAAIPR